MNANTPAVGWLEAEPNPLHEDEWLYPASKIRHEVRDLDGGGVLVLNWEENKFWLKFAVLAWAAEDADGKNVLLQLIFHGEGPTGNLRECRHTWWGENGDGYLFYVDGRVITAAFKALSEFFEMMVRQ